MATAGLALSIFGTTRSVIKDICAVTAFIRSVVRNISSYGADTVDINRKIEHEYTFLDAFQSIVYSDLDAWVEETSLPNALLQDVHNILLSLRSVLAEYGEIAQKYGIDSIDTPRRLDTASAELMHDEATAERPQGKSSKLPVRQALQAAKKKWEKLEWALFEKDKILALLEKYAGWTRRLREVLELVLLVRAAIGGKTREVFAESQDALRLGLRAVALRQARSSTSPPPAYGELEGRLASAEHADADGHFSRRVFADDAGLGTIDVLVEAREYSDELILAFEDEDKDTVDTLMQPIRELVWLLRSASPELSLASESNASERSLHTLDCLGYLNQPDQAKSLLVYRMPPALEPERAFQTLRAMMLAAETDSRHLIKPSLESRFYIAHALAATVLEVHASGWVHKNIWSRGIVLVTNSTSTICRPYLLGWGTARPTKSATALKEESDLELNLYRHPKRYRKPEEKATSEHDIYALGVVLLELGLWRAMSSLFAKPIERSKARDWLPSADQKHGKLLELARKLSLRQEMGSAYAVVVEQCLQGSFPSGRDQDETTQSFIKFRDEVVNVLERCKKVL